MTKPRWIPCPDCDEFFCTLHKEHVFECECPTLEELVFEEGVDPYEGGGE